MICVEYVKALLVGYKYSQNIVIQNIVIINPKTFLVIYRVAIMFFYQTILSEEQ